MVLKVNHSGLISLRQIIDDRDGILCILNSEKEIPFVIKRVYYITNLDSQTSIRGKHAHHNLQQVIFCINGSFTLSLDDGVNKQNIEMKRENEGIILGPMLWHTMHDFSNGCVILVVASDYYNEADYIRNYDEFIKLAKEQMK